MAESKTLANLTTTFLVAGEETDMVIGFQSGEMYLALQRQLPIGSPISVAYWLKEEYAADGDGIKLLCPLEKYKTLSQFQTAYNGYKKKAAASGKIEEIRDLPLYGEVKEHLHNNGIPDAALNIMISAILAEVVLTDLIFQRKDEGTEKTTKAKLGLQINFNAPLVLLPNLAVRKMTLLIMYASNGDLEHFPVPDPNKLPSPEPAAIPAVGWIEFKDKDHAPAENDKITLGAKTWTLVKGTGDVSKLTTGILDKEKPEDTLSRLVADLNKSEDKEINKCKYKLDGTKVMITAQVAGESMNTFKLGASFSTDAKKCTSGDTLTGGVGKVTENLIESRNVT